MKHKNTFANEVLESLNGRDTQVHPTDLNNDNTSNANQESTEPINNDTSGAISKISNEKDVDQKGRTDKGLGKNADGSYRQSKAGRKATSKKKKKVQLPLTLTPATKDALIEWADTKPRSAANYLSEYVEEHLNEIMEYFNK